MCPMQFKTLPLLSTTYFNKNIENQTNKTFEIFHQVNCESSFDIYLLELYLHHSTRW